MKKILALVLSIAMLTAMLAACGGGSSTPTPSADPGANTAAPAPDGGSDGGATKENPHVWKVGTSAGLVNGKHVIYDLILKFKEEVEAATDGRYQIEPYHSSQLGSDRDTLEGTVMGTYQCTVVPGTFASAYVDEFNVFEFPYLFNSPDHFFDTMESDVAKEIGDKLENYGLVWLGNGINGVLSISNSKRDIRTLEDFNGLKIRVIDSPIQVGAVKLLGGTGVVVNWGETYTALQQNTIDGVITTGSGFLSGKIHEVNKFHSAIDIFMSPITIVMNKEYWDTLPEADRQLIQDAAARTLAWHRDTAVDALNADLQTCIEEGPMSEVTYDEFDHDGAKAAMAPLYEEYQDKYGDYFERIAAIDK